MPRNGLFANCKMYFEERRIYGSCLDGTDQCVRLEGYMRGENAWKIDRCYMKRDDYERAVSQPVKNKDIREER